MHEVVIREINELVALSEWLADLASKAPENLESKCVQELSAVAARGGQLIQRLYGPDSHYAQSLRKVLSTPSFTTMHSNYCNHVSELAGILKGVQHNVQSGLLSDFKLLLQAEIFSDFLEMAEHLLNEGYKDAAAVLLGSVLEDSLRKVADGKGVSTIAANGKPFTIDPINVALAKAGVYNPLMQKQVTSWASLRNDAAHGHFDKYDAGQVKQMLLFVQKFCSDYLK